MAPDRAAFLDEQLGLLGPFDFLVLVLPGRPFAAIEVAADEQGHLRLTIPPEAQLDGAATDALPRLGFVQDGHRWARAATPERPITGAALEEVLASAFGADGAVAIDLHHGSRKAEHEATVKIAALRQRLVPLLTELIGAAPTEDADGDFVFDRNSTQVFVAPRAVPGGPIIIRIFAITNIGVSVSPDLALFIARMNFGLMFGRFALDLEHAAVWFIETLLGDLVSDDEIRYSVRMVADTADEWDDRITQMFGGFTRATAPAAADAARLKPGEGGYL